MDVGILVVVLISIRMGEHEVESAIKSSTLVTKDMCHDCSSRLKHDEKFSFRNPATTSYKRWTFWLPRDGMITKFCFALHEPS